MLTMTQGDKHDTKLQWRYVISYLYGVEGRAKSAVEVSSDDKTMIHQGVQ
jgi:hypothetical protein